MRNNAHRDYNPETSNATGGSELINQYKKSAGKQSNRTIKKPIDHNPLRKPKDSKNSVPHIPKDKKSLNHHYRKFTFEAPQNEFKSREDLIDNQYALRQKIAKEKYYQQKLMFQKGLK